MAQPQNPQQIQIDIDPKDADGIYANVAFLHQSAAEFIVDFARIMPGAPRAKVHSRIILTPRAAKAVLRLLEDNVKRYESQHGEIDTAPVNQPIGFQPAQPSQPGQGEG
ncbi:MAG TPA: DUF3467 domain-containing protein [Candidatus Krumholzibacteria bacterium]|nr:DUF3467 domain-containing protein [Candidatus Krumholzibacteria bacterium]